MKRKKNVQHLKSIKSKIREISFAKLEVHKIIAETLLGAFLIWMIGLMFHTQLKIVECDVLKGDDKIELSSENPHSYGKELTILENSGVILLENYFAPEIEIDISYSGTLQSAYIIYSYDDLDAEQLTYEEIGNKLVVQRIDGKESGIIPLINIDNTKEKITTCINYHSDIDNKRFYLDFIDKETGKNLIYSCVIKDDVIDKIQYEELSKITYLESKDYYSLNLLDIQNEIRAILQLNLS